MKILIAGDFCPIGRTEHFLNNEDYASLFNGYQNIVKEVDYAVVNLECPHTTSNQRISKTGPSIKSENENSFAALRFAGFDLLTLANNHILDYGEGGLMDTIHRAEKFGFEVVGAGKNRDEAKKPLIKDIAGLTVGFLNFAENEFCAATSKFAGAYTLDLIDNFTEIRALKKKVDKVILIYHGGREHYQLPTPELRRRFHFFVESGADAIVAHHTHCVSGYEYHQGRPIVYSVGNFIFDYKKKYQTGKWTEGMSVILNLKNEDFLVEIVPHYQGRLKQSSLHLLGEEEKKKFLKKIENLNNILADDVRLMEEWQKYLITQEKFYLSSLYLKNIYVRMLFIKGILPASWLRSRHNKLLLNLFRCETHQEITKNIFEESERKNL